MRCPGEDLRGLPLPPESLEAAPFFRSEPEESLSEVNEELLELRRVAAHYSFID